MIPTKIFLDMDDVLNRFTMYALAHVGCPVDPMSEEGHPSDGRWDILPAVNTLHPTHRFTRREFWNEFNHEAWANIPVSEELELLLKLSEDLVGKENICVLTAPVCSPGCLTGKLEWIQEQLPHWLHQQFLIGPHKHFCAHPDHLLIDDANHNVNAWREHGGQAILMPRPWNSCFGFDATKSILRNFDAFLALK